MNRFVGVLLFTIALASAPAGQFRAQTGAEAPVALRFHPEAVQVGNSVIATVYGRSSTGHLDVRFRGPNSNVDEIAFNWQRGSASAHSISTDTAVGTWTITGVRIHEDPNDHTGDFIPIFAPLTVHATARVAGAFAPTGRLTERRTAHTATLLSDGRVFVAGGSSRSPGLNTAETYDPETNMFSSAGMMVSPRSWHTATLLTNGKVLLVGGYGSTAGQPQSSAELYDPATGTFTPTGNTTSPQWGHTATLLFDGKVLIVGGIQKFGGPPCPCVADAELYDPITERFTAISWPLFPLLPTASLLTDGRVFLASGPYTPNLSEARFGTGQLYDPKTGLFSYAGDPGNVARFAPYWHAGTLLTNGKVLLTGGAIVDGPWYSASAGLFDPAIGAFVPLGDMSRNRHLHTATLLPDGRVLIAAGEGINSAEVYDPSIGVFSPVQNMTNSRGGHTATLLRTGAVLITGGYGDAGTAELYYPALTLR